MAKNITMKNLYIMLLVLLSLVFIGSKKLHSQEFNYKLNTGLLEKQHTATLPRSKVNVEKPEKEKKVAKETQLIATSDNEWILSNAWELIDEDEASETGVEISTKGYDTKNWYNATVPGTVLATLVEQGVFPDPYFGLNNLVIPDSLCRMKWWYRIAFPSPEINKGEQLSLNFEGINYESNVWLNGNNLGSIKGAFIRGEFEIA